MEVFDEVTQEKARSMKKRGWSSQETACKTYPGEVPKTTMDVNQRQELSVVETVKKVLLEEIGRIEQKYQEAW
eukprot:12925157-Prorocentrum_lima.AAC.1